MKRESIHNQNESTETAWPGVLRIPPEEFQQSMAVAQLAVKLWENKIATLNSAAREREKVKDNGPKEFLNEAWKLIETAREHVLREQTNAEYLAEHVGSHEAACEVVGRILSTSRVPFHKLCDPKRNEGDTEPIELLDAETGKIIEVKWKVYRSELGFDDLFWSYWDATSIIKDEGEREKRGQSVLDSWKRDGVAPNDFLALASGYFDFERGVKVITGENRPDRALPSFRRFLKSRLPNEDTAERAMAKYREERFATGEPYLLKNEFAKWKREEKSRNAKVSREVRGKRGRVRSKSDKRLGARYKGKRIVPSKKI